MLEKLTIRNFQCHEKLELAIDPRLTVLVGSSDHGKSAVIRALQWLMFDRPLGDSFIRHRAESCSVVLDVDGRRIGRRKSRQKNLYRMDDEQYKSWGTQGPPEPIAKVLNVSPENFQGQHDPSYWFSLSAGDLAKRLNEIVDLGVIDNVLSAVAGRIRGLRAVVAVTEQRQKQAAEELKRWETVPELLQEFEQLKQQRAKLQTMEQRTLKLAKLIQQLQAAQETVGQNEELIEKLQQAVRLGSALAEKCRAANRLGRIMEELEEAWPQAKLQLPSLDDLTALLGRWKLAAKKVERLTMLHSAVWNWVTAIDEHSKEISRLHEQLHELTGGRCPVCGKEFEL